MLDRPASPRDRQRAAQRRYWARQRQTPMVVPAVIRALSRIALRGRQSTRKAGRERRADKGDRSVALHPSLWKRSRPAVSGESHLHLKMHGLVTTPF
jgi:hypothetical protein